MHSLSSPRILYHSLAAERRSDIKGHSSMAEASLDLEDGERYLPSGILLGEDGWTVRQERLHRHDIPRLQSFFSDGVAGLPCYPADFFSPHPHELSHAVTKSRLTHLVTPQNSYSQQGLGTGCVYRGRGQLPTDCTHCYRSTSEGMRMAENRGRFYPSAAGKMHGGTGVFLPLPRLRGDWGRGQTIGMREDKKWVLPKRDNQTALMASRQGKPLPEIALPSDWTY